VKYNFKKATIRLESDSYLLNVVMLKLFKQYGKWVKGNESKNTNDYLFWRDGIVIEHNNELLYIQYNREKQYIDLYANSNHSNFSLQKLVIDELLYQISDKSNKEAETVLFEDENPSHFIDSLKKLARDNPSKMDWSTNKHLKISVSNDGEHFALWQDIQAAPSPQFISQGHLFNTKDFKHYFNNKNKMKKVFISYSKQDEKMVNTFIKHLSTLHSNNLIESWYCTELKAGEEWHSKIREKLDEADIVCFMISPNFMETPYIHKFEVKRAFERYDSGDDIRLYQLF
jgi:internalin A